MTDNANVRAFANAANDTANEAFRRSSERMDAVSGAGSAISTHFQEMTREWIHWATAATEKSQDHFSALMQIRSPQELMEVQSRMLRENVELLVASAKKIYEITTDMAKSTARKGAAAQES